MRPGLLGTAQALLPIAVCALLALPNTNPASVGDSAGRPSDLPPMISASVTPLHETGTSGLQTEETIDTNAVPATPSEKYFPNDTLMGKPIPCTDEEKECLKYNRIFFSQRRKCYPLADGPDHCPLAVHRAKFQRTGHIKGQCFPTDLCLPVSHDLIRMAYDDRCLRRRHLNTVCGKEPMNLIQHFFGNFECVRPRGISPPEPVYIPQPKEKGRCVFPNLRHDLTSVTNQETRILFKECQVEQSGCFSRKQVWCEDLNLCCDLLKRGPCQEGHRVVLNRTAWAEDDVRAACAPVHPCGNHSRLMAFDRKCHDAATVLRALCPGGVLLPNAFGEMSCVTRDFYRHVIDLRSIRPEFCELAHRVSYDDEPIGITLEPECGLTGRESCVDAF